MTAVIFSQNCAREEHVEWPVLCLQHKFKQLLKDTMPSETLFQMLGTWQKWSVLTEYHVLKEQAHHNTFRL